jgi:hypothetical protein
MTRQEFLDGGYNEKPGGGVACPACTDAALAIRQEIEEETGGPFQYLAGLRMAEDRVIRECRHGGL